MKRFQFLLLDAGPIVKLFELNLWERFIEMCDVSVSRIVADQAKYASGESEDLRIDLGPYEEKIRIFDSDPSEVSVFHGKFTQEYKAIIHDGEKQTLAFLCKTRENWLFCSSDGAIFRVLGLLGRAEQGISLEEVFTQIGFSQSGLEWQYTKKFREKYTRIGKIDSVQDKGLP
jgi:hypothetical protein